MANDNKVVATGPAGEVFGNTGFVTFQGTGGGTTFQFGVDALKRVCSSLTELAGRL